MYFLFVVQKTLVGKDLSKEFKSKEWYTISTSGSHKNVQTNKAKDDSLEQPFFGKCIVIATAEYIP